MASFFSSMFPELQLQIAARVDDPRGRAMLALAQPRLGLAALRALEEYRQPLVAFAATHGLHAGAQVTQEHLMGYATDARATDAGCTALSAWAAEGGSSLSLVMGPDFIELCDGEQKVRRVRPNGKVLHFEGEAGVERVVLCVSPNGRVVHYEGEGGAERMVRFVWPDGEVVHYEGEAGVERKVRVVSPNGQVQHFEGARGTERPTAAPPAAAPPSSEAQQLADVKAMFEQGLIPSREIYEAKVRQILGLRAP